MSVLVVYYSRTGNTRKVAQQIVAGLDADFEEIRTVDDLRGGIGWWKAGFRALIGRPEAIEPAAKDPSAYDLVVIGSPIWMKLTPPVRTYLKCNAGRFQRAAFFVTHGGSGENKAFAEMSRLTGCAPVATLEVKEAELASGAWLGKVDAFVATLQTARSAPTPRKSLNR
jgi:flavodoxin